MSSVYVIAEAGVNHDGSVDTARKLVDAAREAGADAVKFQTFRANRLVSSRARRAAYQTKNLGGDDDTQASMLRALELADADFRTIADHAASVGIEFLSTPFDEASLDLLVGLGVKRIKLGSGDLTNAPLLEKAAATKLPLILSSGMATLGDIEAALSLVSNAYVAGEGERHATELDAFCSPTAQTLLAERVALLHCTTEYPAPLAETNLRVIPMLQSAFGIEIGYSDHTVGIAVSLAAVALGATIIEKHFTLDKTRPGPDHAASIEPAELRQLVDGTRAVELALGTSLKRPGAAERRNLQAARRSLVAATSIAKGTTITREMVTSKRPADGLSPMRIREVVGRVATRDYAADDLLES